MRAPFAILAVLVLSCGGGGTTGSATLTGTVKFTDGSAAADVTVNVLGQAARRVQTGAGGTYSAETLPDGVYVVSVEAADTLETRLSFGVEVKGPTTAPDLVFTPVGTVSGRVELAGMPAPFASVELAGQDKSATADANGLFSFHQVPAGPTTVLARQRGRVATAMVMVKRGPNDAGTLSLMLDAASSGTVTGTVRIPGGAPAKDTIVSLASDLTAKTSDTGDFMLSAPAGDYEVFATPMTPGYAKQSLGRVMVRATETTALGERTLSLYRSLSMPGGVTSATVLATADNDVALVRVSVPTEYGSELWSLDLKTLEHHLLSFGSQAVVTLSRSGKVAAWISSSGSGVFVADPVTGTIVASAGDIYVSSLCIASDDSAIFFMTYVNGGYALARVKVATGVVDTFPGTSSSSSILQLSSDHYLVRSGAASPFDVQLVTPGTASVVFAQVTQVGTSTGVSGVTATPVPVAAYGAVCNISCAVKVLGPATETPLAVATVLTSPLSVIPGSTRDWLGLSDGFSPAPAVLVKVADGSVTNLPTATYELRVNEPGTRMVVKALNLATIELREGAAPPSATAVPFATFSSSFTESGAYLNATRFEEFTATTPPRRYDLKSGVATSDGDVVVNASLPSPAFAGPAVAWTKQSTMKHAALVGDSAELSAEPLVMQGYLTSTFARKLDGTVGDAAAMSDGATGLVFDAVKLEVRKLFAAQVSSTPLQALPDRFVLTRSASSGITLQFFDAMRAFSLSEPNVRLTGYGATAKGAVLAVGIEPVNPSVDTAHRLLVAVVP